MGTLCAMCSEAEAREREECFELSILETRPTPEAKGSAVVGVGVGGGGGIGGGGGGEVLPKPTAKKRADLSRTVKRYQRPAAGKQDPGPHELRPLPTLLETVDYLLRLWVSPSEPAPPLTRYVFISDRLRAVQQDLTVQRLACAPLLARIVDSTRWRSSSSAPRGRGGHARILCGAEPLAAVQRADLSARAQRS